MPELPEVETVMRGLQLRLEGRMLLRAVARRPDLRWPLPPGPGRAPDRRAGRRLPPARQIHPDAAGQRLVGADPSRHVRAHGGGAGRAQRHHPARAHGAGNRRRLARRLRRSAPLRLGRPDRDGARGPAPPAGRTGPGTAGRGVLRRGAGRRRWPARRTPIKAALLDQKIVAGLGNIYVCEALFRAGISPQRLAAQRAGRAGASGWCRRSSRR